MRRFQERACLALAVLLLATGLLVCVALILDSHNVTWVPYWLAGILDTLILTSCALLEELDLPLDALTTSLVFAGVYWVPGLVFLLISRYLRARRIRDEMALK